MATINLLPWRDEYRQEKTREFFSVLILLVVLSAIVGYVWYAFVKVKIEHQQSRNVLLKKEITVLNKQVREIKQLKTQRKELESKMAVIQDLQNKRPLIVYYFDGLVKAVPDGVYLEKLSRKGEVFNISGNAESNSRISNLMRSLDDSPYFKSPSLKSVVKNDFVLDFESEDVIDQRN